MTPDGLLELIDILNPTNEPGRLTLIVRMGADKIGENLPKLVRAVRDAGRVVVWSIDAMHGNTVKSPSGLKTRPFEKILSEIDTFFAVHQQEGTFPGGVHLEMTGDEKVTECLGGQVAQITEEMLAKNFQSACDPRLNGAAFKTSVGPSHGPSHAFGLFFCHICSSSIALTCSAFLCLLQQARKL